MSKYTVKLSPLFSKKIRKLDRQVAKRVLTALYEIELLTNPLVRLKPLQGSKSGLWRYRVGDYRVIIQVRAVELVIIAIDVDHRSSVYKA